MKIKNYKFNHLVYAGTFDRLHIGHQKLLDKAFELGEKVSLAVTTEKLYKSKILAETILSWEERKAEVESYLREKRVFDRAIFFKLDDIFGSSITDKTMDAILATEFTYKNAEKINEIRTKNKLKPLKIIREEWVRGEDGEIISSERIRMGEIDREGKKYQILNVKYKKEIKLPEELRSELRKPLGRLISGSLNQLSDTAKTLLQYINKLKQKPNMVISVGDIITEALLEIDYEPDIKIIDFKSRRKLLGEISKIKDQILKGQIKNKKYSGINQSGTINISTANLISSAIKDYTNSGKKQLLVIDGEEDLLALPAILFAPLQSIVLYGQFDQGVVMVEVSEKKKTEVKRILDKFK